MSCSSACCNTLHWRLESMCCVALRETATQKNDVVEGLGSCYSGCISLCLIFYAVVLCCVPFAMGSFHIICLPHWAIDLFSSFSPTATHRNRTLEIDTETFSVTLCEIASSIDRSNIIYQRPRISHSFNCRSDAFELLEQIFSTADCFVYLLETGDSCSSHKIRWHLYLEPQQLNTHTQFPCVKWPNEGYCFISGVLPELCGYP